MSACVTRVGRLRLDLYPPFARGAEHADGERLTASSGAATPGLNPAAAFARPRPPAAAAVVTAAECAAAALSASSRPSKSSKTSTADSSCTSRTCATMRSTVGNNASSDCVSSFSTALMNPLRFSRLFAKSTLRRGTPPVASPPCLNRFATPSRSVSSAFSAASAARADVASASARRRCSDVSGSSASASTFSDRSCLVRFASGGGIASSSSRRCAAVRLPSLEGAGPAPAPMRPASARGRAGVVPAHGVPAAPGVCAVARAAEGEGDAFAARGLSMPPRSRRMDSHVDLFVSRMPAGLANSISSAAPGTSGETSSCAMSQVNVRWRRAVVVIGIHCDTPEPSGSARRPHSLRTDTAPYSGWHASCSVATAARRASASGEREETATTTAVPIEDVTSNTSSPETSGRGRDGSSPIPTFAVVQGASSPAGRDRRGTGRRRRGRQRARARVGVGTRGGWSTGWGSRARAPDAARVAVETLDRDRRCPADFFCRGPPPPVAAVAAFFGGGGTGPSPRGGGKGLDAVAARTHRFLLPLLGETALALPRQRRVARRDV